MPYKKSYKQSDPKPILTERRGSGSQDLAKVEGHAIGKVVLAALRSGNAIYVQPSRFGTVTLKVYIEGEQFAENLNPGDDWDALCEQIVEALYDISAVAFVRRVFGGEATSGSEARASEAAKGKTPGQS